MSALIEKDNERQYVKASEFQDYLEAGWVFVAENVEPQDNAKFDGEQWVPDPLLAARSEREAWLNTLPREQLVALLMDEIEDLKAQLLAVQNYIEVQDA